MTHYIEELQAKKYLEHLLSVPVAEWQWFSSQRCFEVGDAAARPRLYFALEEQFQMYALRIHLEVDRQVAASTVLHIGRDMPATYDGLIDHLRAIDHPPMLAVLLTKVLRDRNWMTTTPRPEHLRAKVENSLTILRHRLLIDLPHNVRERLTMLKVERNANRVLPRARRSTSLHHR